MLRRLLAFLLLLALSVPAVAMSGHCAGLPAIPAMHAMAPAGEHQHAPAQPERRDCIGCVLPGLGLMVAPKADMPVGVVGAVSLRPAQVLGAERPEVPPPRV